MINHKLTPLLLTDDGNVWMVICLMTLSASKESGDVYIVMNDDQTRYDFNKEGSEFVPASIQELTPREKEVLKFIAIGDNSKEISEKLGISESTIKNHKTRIFRKLNEKTTAEAVFLFASSQGVL